MHRDSALEVAKDRSNELLARWLELESRHTYRDGRCPPADHDNPIGLRVAQGQKCKVLVLLQAQVERHVG